MGPQFEKGQGVGGEGQTLREGNIKPVFFLAGDSFIFIFNLDYLNSYKLFNKLKSRCVIFNHIGAGSLQG